MKGSALLLLIALTSNCAIASDKDALQSGSTDAALRVQGKKIFVGRCAQCHDDDGSKKLPDGTTLLQRLAKSKDSEARLRTRLKNPQERHSVTLYMEEILTRLHFSPAGQSASPAAPR